MKIAISPCPNDTFLFAPWILGHIGKPPSVTFADIQQLNLWALEKKFPLIKISIATLPYLTDYELLPVGTALGFHVGPKIIARKNYTLNDLAHLKVAVPGKQTTAHLLLQKLCPEPQKKHFCLFHEISDLLKNGTVDAGVIIHESRFTFESEGFVEIADLGELWHERFGLPLPLGGLALLKNHPQRLEIIEILQQSYDYAYAHSDRLMPYIMKHAQYPDVVLSHIKTYVNSETRELSQKGLEAIKRLTDETTSSFCHTSRSC